MLVVGEKVDAIKATNDLKEEVRKGRRGDRVEQKGRE